ncbi:MAG: hypothetical protein CM15mP31_4030 [Gammaproteobacteria bacterium]|nr:MAG: hypothetical protein CM15mP31_4030 [Gammaproteobacteria bacterium]
MPLNLVNSKHIAGKAIISATLITSVSKKELFQTKLAVKSAKKSIDLGHKKFLLIDLVINFMEE